MDQQFIDRVIVSIGRLELPSARRAPGSVVFGDAPLEYDLDLLPRRNLRSDLGRNGDLAVRREFAPEVSGLHIRSLVVYIISRVPALWADSGIALRGRRPSCNCDSDGLTCRLPCVNLFFAPSPWPRPRCWPSKAASFRY